MTKLENVSTADLQAALTKVEGKKPTQRLMLAILYKQGPSVPMIAEWFDLREGLLYRWFTELETEPIQQAIHDESSPGRPPKLSDEERTVFEHAIQVPPVEQGFDAKEWTPRLARRYLREEFGIEYTLRHVRRLLREAEYASESTRLRTRTHHD